MFTDKISYKIKNIFSIKKIPIWKGVIKSSQNWIS